MESMNEISWDFKVGIQRMSDDGIKGLVILAFACKDRESERKRVVFRFWFLFGLLL